VGINISIFIWLFKNLLGYHFFIEMKIYLFATQMTKYIKFAKQIKCFRTSKVGNHSHDLSINNSGDNGSHNNMPPHYVLSYIMKL